MMTSHEELLCKAIKDGRVDTCREMLLRGGVDVNSARPLEDAADVGNVEVCEMLLEHGSPFGMALHFVAERGHVKVADLLLRRGATQHKCQEDRRTPLVLAAESGHVAMCELLLDRGAVVIPSRFDSERSPLCEAIRHGKTEVCRLLLDRGALPRKAEHDYLEDVSDALSHAALMGYVDVCRLLVDRGAGKHPQMLCSAAAGGHGEICELLLDRGCALEEDVCGHSPLNNAAQEGRLEACRLFLDRGGLLPNDGESSLRLAVEYGHADVCRLLLERAVGALHRSALSSRLLRLASEKGHTEVCKVLVESGAAHRADGRRKDTPLHKAAENGHAHTCEWLLENGAAHELDVDGNGPLHAACQSKIDCAHLHLHMGASSAQKTARRDEICADVCEVLMIGAGGAEQVCAPNKHGITPLHLAASNGYVRTCEALMNRGATNAPDMRGYTPLHLARYSRGAILNFDCENQFLATIASKGHLAVCRALIRRVLVRLDDSGVAPLGSATRAERDDLMKFMSAVFESDEEEEVSSPSKRKRKHDRT